MFQSKMIVEVHGGRIAVESEPGKGTTFQVFLPVQEKRMKPRLLIVDDDDEIRTQMKWALSADYEILTGRRPRLALELFRPAQPAVCSSTWACPPARDAGGGARHPFRAARGWTAW